MSNAPMTNVRPLLMPVPRARAELGNIGNTKMWELIGEGELETVSIGLRRREPGRVHRAPASPSRRASRGPATANGDAPLESSEGRPRICGQRPSDR
jgi:hypothetical protein